MMRTEETARTPVGGGERCAWCGSAWRPVAVHGHVQCAACGTNADPCCGGERAGGTARPHAACRVAGEARP